MLRYKNSLLERILLEKGTFVYDFPMFGLFVYTPFWGAFLTNVDLLTLPTLLFRHRCSSRTPSQDGQSKSRTYSYAPELGTAAADSAGSPE